MRAAIEPALKAAKELSDRMHYDKHNAECHARLQAALEELATLIGPQRLDVLGPCFLANHELRRECDTLERELNAREGRPSKPDILETAESLLAQCSPEQAVALRGVLLEASLPAPPAPDTTDAFATARVYVERLTARLGDARRDTELLFEIAAEKARRGWMQQAEIDSRRPAAEGFLADTEKCATVIRTSFESSEADYAALDQRRRQLRQSLRGCDRA